jgi:hypothetical protein
MNDFLSLCVFGIIAIVGLFILMTLMRNLGGGQGPYNQYGSEQPRYDDPNVRSRGWFGGRGFRRGTEMPTYDSPNVRSRGWFGGGSSSKPKSSGGYNSPNVKSSGSFGGKKS